jgi:predicted Rdx family selenoprotein
LAAEIQQETGVVAELIKGDGGIFDVAIDGRLRFSKHQTGRYPEPGEIVALIGR